MNREFKFRAYDRIDKIMYQWHPDFFSDMSPVTGYSSAFPDDEDMILMQYTGLKDDKQKEIYEGDILEITNRKAEADIFIEVVNFKSGRWQVGCLELDRFFSIGDSIKVIGNIYE